MRLRFARCALAAAGLFCGCAGAPPKANLAGEYLGGRFAARINDIEGAADAFSRAHKIAPDETAILKDAFFFRLAEGDFAAAVAHARELVARAADEEGFAKLVLAADAVRRNAFDEAQDLVNRTMGVRIAAAAGFLADVWIERGRSGPEAALQRLQKRSADFPPAFALLPKALLAEQAGRLEDARAAYLEVAGLGEPMSRAAYGAFLERSGDRNEAERYYADLAASGETYRRQAEAALERLRRRQASSDFQDTGAAQGLAIAYYWIALAMVADEDERRERALAAGYRVGEPRYNFPLAMARLANRLAPDLVEVRWLVASILNDYRHYAEARALLEEIPSSSPYYEASRVEIARGLIEASRLSEAARALRAAIARDPEGRVLRLTLADVYASQRRPADAVATLNQIIPGFGDPPPADAWRYFLRRGAARLELGRWEAAEADLKRAVEIAPDEPDALNYLGYSWAERGLSLDEAFGLIEKAVAMRPNSGAIVDSLGWAHYQLGRYADAVLHLEQAIALEPSDPTVADHLGDAYWRVGRKLEAGYQWRRSLELEPEETLARRLREKIAQGLEEGTDEPAAENRR